MSMPQALIGQVRDVAAKIQALQNKLMENRLIPMSEQAKIHAEIQQLKKHQDTLEKRTR